MEKRELIDALKEMSYQDKKDVYNAVFSLGKFNVSDSVNDKMILISLVTLTYMKLRQQNANIRAIDILCKITNSKKDESSHYQMLEGLGVLCEDMSYCCKTADSCGLQNSNDIINKIKQILGTWSPF